MDKRVVVTGIGIISSIGIGKDAFWKALTAGESGIRPITSFDTSGFPTHNGGEIKGFLPEDFMSRKRAGLIGRTSALAIAASRLALTDADLKLSDSDKDKTGVVLGTTMGETQVFERINYSWVKGGEQAVDSAWLPRLPANVLSANVGIEFKFKGPNLVLPNACAAGNYAVGYAADLIRTGVADIMLAGGSDAFSKIAFTGFNRLFAVAPQVCQPFDKDRKGIMVGEGAAILVLESLAGAQKRNANILAEVSGYGLSCDAHHMTAPHAPGIARAMRNAFKECSLGPQDIDYISAHGTGTPANDREECLAIKNVFGDLYRNIPVSSIKSMLGHTMGAASAIESVACCLAIKHGTVPPTINFKTPDPECDIDCVPNICRRLNIEFALNNASAFGGNNASVIFRKFTPS
jgi:3-oxoacyl-[acyl-carrier-protein] synthase II